MALLLKNAHVVDPSVELDGVVDVLIDGDKIAEVGENLAVEGAEVRDLSGKYLVPGLVDMHVHLREPGYEVKEDIESGTRAAAKGGFTGVCAMPNTDPVTDNGTVVEFVKSRAAEVGHCRVYPSGAMTRGLKGEAMSEMGDMVAHGAVAFTDDGRGVQGAGMLRRCMDYGKMFGKVFMSHCQDEDLVGHGQINEGKVSTRLALEGWPAAGEELQIARDIEIAKLTGAKLHIQHISTAHGLEIVRAGKAAGVQVTCEATPHHMFLTENDLDETYNTSLKVNPPLRTDEDAEAIRQGVIDGTVDVIVTDHAPHTPWRRPASSSRTLWHDRPRTSLSLVLTELVNTGKMSMGRMVELMAIKPREIWVSTGSGQGGIRCRPDRVRPSATDGWRGRLRVARRELRFAGRTLTGRATDGFVGGKQTLADGCIC
ncbi:MAG: dihydroorotase [Collinsella sp.]